MQDVIIVGAGLSGLIAGQMLQDAGLKITIVDKGRSVGGRLATRRIAEGRADHGAQFFTVRDERFQSVVTKWLADDLVYQWATGWTDGSADYSHKDGHPRYAVQGGMNALAKYLAETIDDIRVNIKVDSIKQLNDGWQHIDEDGQVYQSHILLLTPPVPQSLVLLQAGNVKLHPADHQALTKIKYGECLCGLFELNGDFTLPEPGAVQNHDETFYWLADNQHKGISKTQILTVHANPDYSHAHYDAPVEDVLADMRERLNTFGEVTIISQQLKKWRYAIPLAMHDEPCLVAQDVPTLVFAGDAFGGQARVEGAFLSGLSAGEQLIQLTNTT